MASSTSGVAVADASASPITQPKWHSPVPSSTQQQAGTSGLVLYNSLTRQKDVFIPLRERCISWYSCGPTVYDASHMGHARSFLTFDILRRVMEDYFGYRVNYVMNITDIDDKIIVRARQNFLCAEFKGAATALSPEVVEKVSVATAAYIHSKLVKQSIMAQLVPPHPLTIDSWPIIKAYIDDRRGQVEHEVGEKFTLYMNTSQRVYDAVLQARRDLADKNTGKEQVDKLLDSAYDVLALQLDAEKGSTVTDHHIFRDLAKHWENEFMVDMQALNIRAPTILTRVSEYVPEIVKFVEKIVDNGFAYGTADGSVYFDVAAFKAAKHDYAKLAPWSAGHSGLLEEGEGSLGCGGQGKKSQSDFALWKASKPGEPFWPSPWGKGRPGWHIECSAMAGDVLGECMDIHSGGIDLCFPHHDNELAQSEAHFGNQQWVNYFLHAGHLHIEGQKMSKSLKNFITIKEALKKYTAAQIRTMMLMHSWDSVLDYKEASMQHAIGVETTFKNFFQNVKALKRAEEFKSVESVADTELKHNFNTAEKNLLKLFHDCRDRMHSALCDSINTSAAMSEMLDLVSKCNVYLNEKTAARQEPNASLLEEVAKHLTRALRMFGVLPSPVDEIGYPSASDSNDAAGVNKEETVMPYLNVMSTFRDAVRELARVNGDNLKKDLLKMCDELRDVKLPALGVVVEDREGAASLIKVLSPAEVQQLHDEKAEREALKRQAREENVRQAQLKKLERLEKGRTPPAEMFRSDKAYSAWDEKGVPTHDADSQPLTKSRLKKLCKEFEQQTKLHTEFTNAVNAGEIKY